MAYRTLDLTLISANDLKDVNHFHKLEVYAEVVLSTDPRSKQRTLTDHEGTKNPTWNSTLRFTVTDDPDTPGILSVILRAERSLGDRDVGEVHIELKEFLETAKGGEPTEPKFVSYQVLKPCGKPKGVLNISYKLSERITVPSSTTSSQPHPPPPPGYPTPASASASAQPVTAYPVASNVPTAYPAPPPYTFAPPQQYGYVPPAPQPGYGYAPAQQPVQAQKKKKNGLGLGLGAGLIGGAIGGLILGDIVSDAAEDVYEAGYDAGFDDASGFDF